MYALATFDSGNYVLNFYNRMKEKGFIFEVVSTPCHISKYGCGYSLKFPIEYKDMLIAESISNNTPIREIYKITTGNAKSKYVKIY